MAVRAPEILRPDTVWFNVPEPLSLKSLRGRMVLLDFWTSCCINCVHVLPTLARIEAAFPGEVAVIGVHAPKFPAEHDPDHVARAIASLGIRHPVVHDPRLRLWQEYAVRAWPTLVFVGPDGYVAGEHRGEPDGDGLLAAITAAVGAYRQGGVLRPATLPTATLPDTSGRLRFPSKIVALPGDGPARFAVADTGHHQIVLFDDRGRETARLGDGVAGLRDGAGPAARFDRPQGLAAADGVLFVADTGNHALRRIELAGGAVATLAGTGRRGGILGAPQPAGATALASPWDCVAVGGRLFFANAGTHQIGLLDLAAGQVMRFAGTGAEGLHDGPAADSVLAQPSGLALAPDGDALYLADSEASAVRKVTLGPAPRVETLVGAGLFDFGHVNGSFAEARLQHPLGVAAWGEGHIIVADSYNGALRVLDLGDGSVADLDAGFTCADEVCLPYRQPAAVAVAGAGRLLLADTGNHRIVEIDAGARTTRRWDAAPGDTGPGGRGASPAAT